MARSRFDPEAQRRAMEFGEQLRKARESRGWTWSAASERSKRWFKPRYQLGTQQIKNLESGETDPLTITLSAALSLSELFFPDLKLADFTGAAGPWKLQPSDQRAADRMRYRT